MSWPATAGHPGDADSISRRRGPPPGSPFGVADLPTLGEVKRKAGAPSVCKRPVQFRAPIRGIGTRLRTDRINLPQVFALLVPVRLHPFGELTPSGGKAFVWTAVNGPRDL